MKIDTTFATFNPREYLNEYYTTIGLENRSLLEFFIEAYDGIPKNSLLLEFGGGPTIYQLITAVKYASEIHFSDHLNSNLKEVQMWKYSQKNAFDWSKYFNQVLILEGEKKVTKALVESRKILLQSRMRQFLHCDAFKSYPLGQNYKSKYDIVSVNFVAESITQTHTDWKKVFKNIHSLLKKNGHLIMTAIKEAKYWRIGHKLFPAVNITESHLHEMLKELGFKEELIFMRSISAETNTQGYNGMIFFRAKRT